MCNREGTRTAEGRKHSTEGGQAPLDAVFSPAPLSAAPSTETARHGGRSDSDEQERGAAPEEERSVKSHVANMDADPVISSYRDCQGQASLANRAMHTPDSFLLLPRITHAPNYLSPN